MIKKVQIVGGNSDIGYSLSKKFANDGFNIQLISKNLENLKKKKNEIESQFNVKCEIIKLDLEDEYEVNSFFENNNFNVSVLIMAVGYLEKNETNYNKIINLNYRYLVSYIEKALIKFNKEDTLKTIIGISSVAGDRGKKKNNIYSSAKAGFSNYLDGLRQRLYEQDIKIITVKPGYVETKMTNNLNLPKILVSDVSKVAEIIFKSYKKEKNIVYAPTYWRYILIIYRMVPEFIFKLLIRFRK